MKRTIVTLVSATFLLFALNVRADMTSTKVSSATIGGRYLDNAFSLGETVALWPGEEGGGEDSVWIGKITNIYSIKMSGGDKADPCDQSSYDMGMCPQSTYTEINATLVSVGSALACEGDRFYSELNGYANCQFDGSQNGGIYGSANINRFFRYVEGLNIYKRAILKVTDHTDAYKVGDHVINPNLPKDVMTVKQIVIRYSNSDGTGYYTLVEGGNWTSMKFVKVP